MKTKRCGIYVAVVVVMLVSALLVLSCFEPINPSNLNGNSSGDMRTVRLSFGNDGSSKTIMPTAPDVDDMFYDVIINAVPEASGINYTALQAFSKSLSIANHTFLINAYREYELLGTNVIAATWTDSVAVVGGTGPQTVNVVLKPITAGDATNNGTFAWDLAIADIEEVGLTATLGVYAHDDFTFSDPLGADGDPGSLITLTDLNLDDEGFDLPAGEYRVRISITRTGYQSIVVTEVLYIYQGLVSTFEESFGPLNPTVYTMTLDYNHSSATSGGIPGGTVNHGNNFTEPSKTVIPTGEERDGYGIDKWTRDDAGTATPPFVFGALGTPVYRPYIFYAQWIATSRNVTVAVTFDIDYPADSLLINGGDPVEISHDYIVFEGGDYEITISGDDIDEVNIKWQTVDETEAFIVIANGDTLIIDDTNIGLFSPGPNNWITVSVPIEVKPGIYENHSTTFCIDVKE